VDEQRGPLRRRHLSLDLTDTARERNGPLFADRRHKNRPGVDRPGRSLSAAAPADAIAEIQIVHAAQRASRHDAEEQGDL
jgi:hypothetical protein